ncbi:ABC transporter ATP-binding protein [Pimelobacter simplex]|uniref:ABC transporter ATP-binding protein n=1 Tax=Nocardioides simplex TaxID=2045 RepID=UPI003AAAB9EC
MMVGLAGVTHSYKSVRALDGVTLHLRPGITVLLGRNGAGKSTLCRVLTGIERPDDGEVVRDGQALEHTADWRSHHARTGWLPQHLAAPMSMRVEQYLRYACWLKKVGATDVEARLEEAMVRTDLVEHRRRRLRQLSGGMLRRAGIAQAIVHEPSLLVLDEPTVGLDPEQRAWFHQIVRSLAADRTVFISTHLLEDVEAFPGRVVVLNRGAVCFDGTTDDLAAYGRAGSSEEAAAAAVPAAAPDVAESSSPQERLRAGFLAVLAASDRGRDSSSPERPADPPRTDAGRPSEPPLA